MNKQYLVAVLLTAVAAWALFDYQNTQQPYSFEQYKADYQKNYQKSGEEQYRKTIFLRNLVRIAEHNANQKNTYQMGVNQFTDLTDAEFQALYLTLIVPKKNIQVINQKVTPLVGDVDWSSNGMVSAVKNQGACGSCWAFAAVAALESATLQKGGSGLFSEQQLVDCSGAYGNQGCNGGWMDSAFQYVTDNGLASQAQYPYKARDQACQSVSNKPLSTITAFVDTPGCDNLINALNARPISVAVDASNWSPYRGGVFGNCKTNINHGVLLIGATDAFWKIKNSWGATWGEAGYIRISRGNTCAICDYPSYPVL